MHEPVRASVAMAVCNGEPFLKEQIDSILTGLSDRDELVISYDASGDNTLTIVREYAQKDPRVRVTLHDGPTGFRQNFENAIRACRGSVILLADQDDYWLPAKTDAVLRCFSESGADLVVHDGYMTDEALHPLPGTIFERFGKQNGPVRNTIRCTFWGCCMAFRRELLPILLPIPTTGQAHDMWIGVLCGIYGRIERLPMPLVLHRLHGANQSAPRRRALTLILRDRALFLGHLIRRMNDLRKIGIRPGRKA